MEVSDSNTASPTWVRSHEVYAVHTVQIPVAIATPTATYMGVALSALPPDSASDSNGCVAGPRP